MDAGSIGVLTVVGIGFVLAVRHLLRHGSCEQCAGGKKGGCGCGCGGGGAGGEDAKPSSLCSLCGHCRQAHSEAKR
jgi:hypothetical protein